VRYQLTSLRLYTHKPETYTSRTDQTLVWQVVHEAAGRPVLTAGCLCLQGPRAPSSSTHLQPGKSRPAPAPRRALPSGSVGRPPLWTSSSRIPHQSLSGYVCAMFEALLCINLSIMCCSPAHVYLKIHHRADVCILLSIFGIHNLCLCMFCITLVHQSCSNIQCEVIR